MAAVDVAGGDAPDSGRGLAAGLKVVEVGSSVAVAVAGVAMADAGAETIMIEPPGGNALRHAPAFAMWGRGKQSVTADLATEAGRRGALELLADADVCLIGLKPASIDRLGLDYEHLRSAAPSLVVAVLSGFGTKGPFRDIPVYDGVIQARGGRMAGFSALVGGDRPAFAAAPVAAHSAAAALLLGVFGALREREHNGGWGQLVETSLAHALGVYDLVSWAPGTGVRPVGEDIPFLPYSTARTADGVWIQFAQNGPALFADFIRVLGLDSEFDAMHLFTGAEPALKRAARARVLEQVATATWAQWQERFADERNLSVEPFLEPGGALGHPQFEAIGDVVAVVDETRGVTRQLGPLFDVPAQPLHPRDGTGTDAAANTPAPAPVRPAPSLKPSYQPGPGLLAGVTVLELGMWIALPFAAAQLADLGATVIKLEALGGDPMRATGPVAFKVVQGKKSMMIDLKAPGAREIVRRLVAGSDVLMHSYRPGVPERLGIDFESVRAVNPRIVYVYNGSYGSNGPKAYAPAFHVTGGAVAGGAFAQAGAGWPPGPDRDVSLDEAVEVNRRLHLANEANPDFNSAVVAAAAAVMGLYARERTGEAIEIETRMMLSCAWMMSEHFIDYADRPDRQFPDADLYGIHALYRLYPTRNGWVFLAAPQPRDFARLCDVLDLGEVAGDRRFATAHARAANDAALADRLAREFARHEADQLEHRLSAAGVACVRADEGPYSAWCFDADWARDQGIVTEAPDSQVGPYLRHGPVVATARPHRPGGAHPAGADTRELLGELGFSDEQIDALIADHVVAEPDT